MAIKKTEKRAITSLTTSAIKNLGYNMLESCVDVEVTDLSTGDWPKVEYPLSCSRDTIKSVYLREDIGMHIDIFAKQFDIIFDLGKVRRVEQILFASIFDGMTNYTIEEFELYASDTKESLFSSENKIAHENDSAKWFRSGKRNNSDWLYDVEGELRFFGVKVISSNPTDDIARIKDIGLYSDSYSKQRAYIPENFPKSLLGGMEPAAVTDGIVFEDGNGILVDGEKTFSWKLDKPTKISKAWVVADGLCKVSFNNLSPGISEISFGRYCYIFDIENPEACDEISVKISGNATVEQIGAFSNERTAEVHFQDEINTDFLGIGANVLPMSFMEKSMEVGYNEVYWELEECRIMKAKPNVVRMWFHPDWVAFNYDDYKNGNYSFDNNKMYSVYKYLDAFKKAGTEILFNYGWKVSSYAQDWFSFPEIPKSMQSASAPRELDLFAKCCAELLEELIVNRGYDNIKYLTFYNEPNWAGNDLDRGDFIVAGCDRKEYWKRMLIEVKKEVSQKKLDIKYWGAEVSATDKWQLEWIEYFEKENLFDCQSVHAYSKDSERITMKDRGNAHEYFEKVTKAAGNTPVMVTECHQGSQPTWTMNHFQYLWEFTRHGVSGALIWCMNGMFITDPLNFSIRGGDMWDTPQMDNAIHNVGEVFYEWAMLSHYIPTHSTSVKTNVTAGSDDIRVCGYKTKDDNYTVVLECNKSTEARKIKIGLDKSIGKKVYKHVLKRPICCNANMILPPTVKVMDVDDVIEDTVSCDFQAVVYTTLPPVPQIELSNVEVFMSPGTSFGISASTVDCDGDIQWEITKTVGNPDAFILSPDGSAISTASQANPGDMCAIKAQSKKNPKAYSVMICKIK